MFVCIYVCGRMYATCAHACGGRAARSPAAGVTSICKCWELDQILASGREYAHLNAEPSLHPPRFF